jgi:hypothetical protein
MKPTFRILCVVSVLAVGCGGTSAIAAVSSSNHASSKLAGIWLGRYSGAFSGTFTLRWTQSRSKLSGSITLSNPRGKYGISGSVQRSAIKFGAVGVGATYTGTLSGTSMSGSYKTPQGGGTWSAQKEILR